MNKAYKKALRFAYDLLKGRYPNGQLQYVYPSVPADLRGDAPYSPAPWIEPDRDPQRPYLNEAVLAALVMRGYLETQAFEHISGQGPVWLYRLTADGCAKLGWDWPKHSTYPITLHAQQQQRLAALLPPSARDTSLNRPPRRKVSIDPNRFRRSNDWRKR